MNKETIYRTLRLIGAICTVILAVIGAMGVDVPTFQEFVPAGVGAAAIALISEAANHWFNNNYSAGAKMAQPSIKEYNSAIKNEVNEMGRGDTDE